VIESPALQAIGGSLGAYIDFYRFISVGAIMSSPLVDGSVLFFGSMDGNLYALR